MPIFSYTSSYTSSGQTTYQQSQTAGRASPKEALQLAGPRMPIHIVPTEATQQTLKKRGIKPPMDSLEGEALVDTGATFSAIDIRLARALRLSIVNQTRIATPSDSSHAADVYSGIVVHIKHTEARIALPSVVGANLQALGIQALLGRDVLAIGILVYSGHTGSFSFSI